MKHSLSLIAATCLLIHSVSAQDDLPNTASIGTNILNSSEGRAFAGRLAPHESIYFLYGSETPAAKFQFSFKYRVLGSSQDNQEADTFPSLNFAYTQRSLWDTEADSSPFFDTSYMPEIFFESSRREPQRNGALTWYGQQVGLKHESNGRDGPNSRSLNTLYYRPVFAIGPTDRWHFLFAPEAYIYITDLDDNPMLPNYRGYGQLRGAIAKKDGPALGYTIRSGKDFDKLTYQLDFTVPVRIQILNLAGYLQIQYFDGYGESLLSYQEQSNTLRLGFSVVR